MKKLSIGIQSFQDLRENDYLYIDKTNHIYQLINSGKVYFLSRPRRFGKSLLINTFEALFEGNKQLFEGLYIYDKWDWSKKYPVIHLDFTELDYTTSEQLELSLDKFLDDTAKRKNITLDQTKTCLISSKFSELIKKLHESSGEQIALLIDEYDKPMI
ncbi:MAG: AAA family ATPase, partial [Endomicrobium sp.]|nr:AAA family ATPase [Endomicrobium sp.]